jgi:hypothetical protein
MTEGYTEALMLAHGFTIAQPVELVDAGLPTERRSRLLETTLYTLLASINDGVHSHFLGGVYVSMAVLDSFNLRGFVVRSPEQCTAWIVPKP